MRHGDTPQPELSARDRQLAALLASGMIQADAAKQLKISRPTVARAVAKPGFKGLVRGFRDEAAAAVAGEFISGAREAAIELRRLATNGKPGEAVKVSACRVVAEFCIRWHEHLGTEAKVEELILEVAKLRDELKQAQQPSPPAGITQPVTPTAAEVRAHALPEPEPEPEPEPDEPPPAETNDDALFE